MRRNFVRILSMGFGVALSVVIGLAQITPEAGVYSLEKERALGERLAEEIEQTSEMLNDPVVTNYVEQLARKLGQDPPFPITLKVVRSEDVRASVIPGGFLYPTSGLLVRAETEAQMAGLLAHQVAHITARHGTRFKSQTTNTAGVPLVFVGPSCIRLGGSYAIPRAMLSQSAEFEKEADQLGLESLYKAGYDPAGLVEFFGKLQTEGKISRLIPMDSEFQMLQLKPFETLPKKTEYKVTSSEFNAIRTRLLAATGRAQRAQPPSLRKEN